MTNNAPLSREEVIDFLHYLKYECGYVNIQLINEYEYVAIYRLAFTHAIIRGTLGNRDNFDDRWCYHNYESARRALAEWGGVGEPNGWHRHPGTGHRREDGKEFIRW